MQKPANQQSTIHLTPRMRVLIQCFTKTEQHAFTATVKRTQKCVGFVAFEFVTDSGRRGILKLYRTARVHGLSYIAAIPEGYPVVDASRCYERVRSSRFPQRR